MSLGDWRWVERTGGRLNAWDDAVLTAQAASVMMKARFGIRARSGGKQAVDLGAIRPPDTPICRAAEALSFGASPDWLHNHNARAYLWGRLILAPEDFDDEAAYIACILHDLGLTEAYWEAGPDICFTRSAARTAAQLARDHGWSDRRAYLVADAIALHLNVEVGEGRPIEQRMVRTGSGADVAGLGLSAVPRRARLEVCERYPRLDLKVGMVRTLDAHVACAPRCRLGFLYRKAGFRDRVVAAPFDS